MSFLEPQKRSAKPEGHRYGSAEVIYWRMRRIDKAQGCHASLETLSTPGDDGDSRSTTLSVSQTRRIIARLRAAGQIVYAGSTLNGCNVYLFPDRKYDPKQVPIHASRPPLWSVDGARGLFSDNAPSLAEAFLVDGYPVNRRLRAAYSAQVIKAAIAQIRRTAKYKDETAIRSHSALLKYFCQAVLNAKRKAEDTLREEQNKRELVRQAATASSASRWPALSFDAEQLLKQFLGRNAASPPSPAPSPVPHERGRRAASATPATRDRTSPAAVPRAAQAPPGSL